MPEYIHSVESEVATSQNEPFGVRLPRRHNKKLVERADRQVLILRSPTHGLGPFLFLDEVEESRLMSTLATPKNSAARQERAQAIEQARDWYSRSKGVVFADYRGLSVKEMQALRKQLGAKGGEIHVIKNTLFRIAIGDDATHLSEDLSSGPTAVAFLYENETECAKVLFDFATSSKKMQVKGALLAGKAYDAKQTEAFSKLPPRDVLIAQVIGAIAAPLSNLVGVVEALYADPIRVIGAVADKVAEGSPLPTPSASESSSAPAAEEAAAEPAPAEEAEASTEATPEN